MRIDHGTLGWGVFLVVLGAVPLAVNQGWLPADLRWWELWPLILVGIGIGILLRRGPFGWLGGLVVAATFGAIIGGGLSGAFILGGFSGGCLGGTGDAFPAQSGNLGSGSATVALDMGCGDLTVSTATGSSWTIGGSSDHGRAPIVHATSDTVSAKIDETGGLFGARSKWTVTLPTAPQLALNVAQNAGSARLDLEGANLASADIHVNAGDGRIDLTGTSPASLSLDVNAGSARVQLPNASMTGDLTVNAGSISICTAPGTALRLRANDNITAGFNYDKRGLVRSGSTWTSPDYDSATVKIDLSTTANAGSFTLAPEEGCQ
jgi:hypothetical protein